MSLLMEALKKAEASRKAAEVSENQSTDESVHAPSEPSLSLEPLEHPLEENRPSLHRQSTPHINEPKPSKKDDRLTVSADAAKKDHALHIHPVNSDGTKPPISRSKLLYALLATFSSLLLASVSYVAYRLYDLSRPAALVASSPSAPHSTQEPPTQQFAPKAEQLTESTSARPLVTEPAKISDNKISAPVETKSRAPQDSPANLETPRTETPVRFHKTPDLRVSDQLQQAYAALQTGDFLRAQRTYEQYLHTDPANTDALLGLATVFAQTAQTEKALSFYRQALKTDPKNAVALAGVTALQPQMSNKEAELSLKTLIEDHPKSAALRSALGALLAQQKRWHEAQQSFFDAYTLAPNNADITFNLAVCLDQLRQNKLAIQYYEKAIQAAKEQRTVFDLAQAQKRLAELQTEAGISP